MCRKASDGEQFSLMELCFTTKKVLLRVKLKAKKTPKFKQNLYPLGIILSIAKAKKDFLY